MLFWNCILMVKHLSLYCYFHIYYFKNEKGFHFDSLGARHKTKMLREMFNSILFHSGLNMISMTFYFLELGWFKSPKKTLKQIKAASVSQSFIHSFLSRLIVAQSCIL